MGGVVEWALFVALSLIAVVTAGGMLVTMSMYRAGLALMASFVALAGLFVLLDADLLAAIQVMMNVGGMVVMILFMVMLMQDPGGAMMWDMKRQMRLPGPGAFSMTMPREKPPADEPAAQQPEHGQHADDDAAGDARQDGDWTCPMHPEVSAPGPGACPKCGMVLIPRRELAGAPPEEAPPATYTCPMHPEVRQPGPGACPKCSMALVPARAAGEGEDEPGGEQTDQGHQGRPVAQRGDEHAGQAHQAASAAAHGDERRAPASDGERHAPPHDGGHAEPPPAAHQRRGEGEADQGEGSDQQTHGGSEGADGDAAMAHDHGGMGGMSPRQHYQMLVDMAMSTAQLPWALALGAATAVALIVLLGRTTWPLSTAAPTSEASLTVGELLLSRYMLGFEGAAFLILGGIAGSVLLAKREGGLPPLATAARAGTERQPAAGQVYTCPMHPEVRQPGPGNCPKCGMALVAASEQGEGAHGDKHSLHVHQGAPAAGHSAEHGAPEEATVYTCPMHPEVRQGQPGRCPKCGMALVPADPTSEHHDEHGGSR